MAIVVLIIVFRLALPYIVLKYVNNTLANLNGYHGHVKDIDIHLLRGAYSIDSIIIDRVDKKIKIPFFSAKQIDLSIQWKQVWKGALVGEVDMFEPKVNFVAEAPNGKENDWREPVKKLFPLKINRLGVHQGEIHYRDFQASPDIDLYMRSVEGEATNLTNSDKLSNTYIATLNLKGIIMKDGNFVMKVKFDPFADQPAFDLDANLEKMNATELNDFFKAYGKFDVQDGQVGLYVEAAAKNGKINGYVKPLIENLNVLKPKEEKPGPLKFIYEGIIEGLGEIFKNHPHDRIATRAEFQGSLDNPKVNIWGVIIDILRNAFVEVLLPGIDHTVSLSDPPKDKEDKKEEKRDKKNRKKEEKK